MQFEPYQSEVGIESYD